MGTSGAQGVVGWERCSRNGYDSNFGPTVALWSASSSESSEDENSSVEHTESIRNKGTETGLS